MPPSSSSTRPGPPTIRATCLDLIPLWMARYSALVTHGRLTCALMVRSFTELGVNGVLVERGLAGEGDRCGHGGGREAEDDLLQGVCVLLTFVVFGMPSRRGCQVWSWRPP